MFGLRDGVYGEGDNDSVGSRRVAAGEEIIKEG